MTQQEIDRINAERLTDWGIQLAHAHATAMLMIGIGHDDELGMLNVVAPAGIDDEILLAMLEDAARTIRAGGHRTM
jgi:2-hydroxychromene-2-carboxylate isomerase